jgi:hypothetical protein
MAIARKPGSKPAPADDEQAERFISAAGRVPEGPPLVAPDPPAAAADSEGDNRRKPVMIRFDRDLLARVDKAAKNRGVNRSAFISYVISRALETE